MRACWMFMVLLSCRFSHATESQIICEDKLHVICVPVNDNVTVPCPPRTEDITYKLLKDEEVIFNRTCINDVCQPQLTREGVKLHQDTNKSVSLTLTALNVNTYGKYRCEGTRNYPPPAGPLPSPRKILVLVEGHQCRVLKNDTVVTGGGQKEGGEKEVWIWILGLVLVSIYSLIVSITAVIIWVKWRRSVSYVDTDYMNTKPKAPRDGRKKRGIQMPIPRHF